MKKSEPKKGNENRIPKRTRSEKRTRTLKRAVKENKPTLIEQAEVPGKPTSKKRVDIYEKPTLNERAGSRTHTSQTDGAMANEEANFSERAEVGKKTVCHERYHE